MESLHSPIELETILAIYYLADPTDAVLRSPANRKAVIKWINLKLIVETKEKIKITDKGRAFIKLLLDTPVPTNSFINPLTNEIINVN